MFSLASGDSSGLKRLVESETNGSPGFVLLMSRRRYRQVKVRQWGGRQPRHSMDYCWNHWWNPRWNHLTLKPVGYHEGKWWSWRWWVLQYPPTSIWKELNRNHWTVVEVSISSYVVPIEVPESSPHFETKTKMIWSCDTKLWIKIWQISNGSVGIYGPNNVFWTNCTGLVRLDLWQCNRVISEWILSTGW